VGDDIGDSMGDATGASVLDPTQGNVVVSLNPN